MQSSDYQRFLERFAPRWTWLSAVWAGAITLGFYLLLPGLESMSPPPERTVLLRTVTTVALPPPLPPPERLDRPAPERSTPPRPQLEPLRRRLAPLQAVIGVEAALGGMSGDFDVDLGLEYFAGLRPAADPVYALGDLNALPRALAQRDPVYPYHARRRNIEGFVMADFTVAADGAVLDIVVVTSEPADVFDQVAVQAIKHWRFQPGTRDGQEVAARVRQKLHFRLQ